MGSYQTSLPQPHPCPKTREKRGQAARKRQEKQRPSGRRRRCQGGLPWKPILPQSPGSTAHSDECASMGSGKVSPLVTGESDRNLSGRLIIPPVQQFIARFSQGHLRRQPNKGTLRAIVPRRPDTRPGMQVIRDPFQLICSHLGRALHRPGMAHICHGLPAVTAPVFPKNGSLFYTNSVQILLFS